MNIPYKVIVPVSAIFVSDVQTLPSHLQKKKSRLVKSWLVFWELCLSELKQQSLHLHTTVTLLRSWGLSVSMTPKEYHGEFGWYCNCQKVQCMLVLCQIMAQIINFIAYQNWKHREVLLAIHALFLRVTAEQDALAVKLNIHTPFMYLILLMFNGRPLVKNKQPLKQAHTCM